MPGNRWLSVLLCVVASGFAILPRAAAHAQTPTRTVSGTVFDSVAGLPLVGAVVQLVRVDEGDARIWSTAAVTNEAGRYRIEGVTPGRYLIGFQHDALNAFAVEAPARRVDVPASTSATEQSVVVDLAMPSAAELRAALCDSNASGGLIAGYVVDGRSGVALEGAAVTIAWSGWAVQDDTVRRRPIERIARVREDGTYRICGPSTDEPLAVTVAKDAYLTLRSEVTISNAGVARRDYTLADSTGIAGSGRVTGRVARPDGTPVLSAKVTIPALALEQQAVYGRFSLSKVPSGRWLLEVRALGFERWERVVEIGANASADVSATMVALPQTLAAARVVGVRPGSDELVIAGILERQRIAAGTMFLPGNPWLRDALFPADVVRAARGFAYKDATTISARLGCVLTGDAPPPTRSGATTKTIALYVDGERLRGGLPALNNFVPIKDVLAIETYPDVTSAPANFKARDACAVIAVWTKRDP